MCCEKQCGDICGSGGCAVFSRKAGCIFQTGVFLFYPVGLCADAGCTSVVETVFPLALSFFPGEQTDAAGSGQRICRSAGRGYECV